MEEEIKTILDETYSNVDFTIKSLKPREYKINARIVIFGELKEVFTYFTWDYLKSEVNNFYRLLGITDKMILSMIYR